MASMSMLGVIISFAVIYISSLISFEELKRELSTLMMLGLKSRECLEVILHGTVDSGGGSRADRNSHVHGSQPSDLGLLWRSDMYTIPGFIDGKALLQAIGLTAVSVGSEFRYDASKAEKNSSGGPSAGTGIEVQDEKKREMDISCGHCRDQYRRVRGGAFKPGGSAGGAGGKGKPRESVYRLGLHPSGIRNGA